MSCLLKVIDILCIQSLRDVPIIIFPQFCLTKLKVEYPVPQWFYQKDDGEDNDDNDDINEMVILSVGNSLKKLSGEILWHLPGLVQLDISNNPSLRIEEPLRPSELIMNR